MIRRFTEGELIELWKQKRGLLPSSQIKTQDQYTPLDKRLALEIRQWYAKQLLTAPYHFLPVADIKNECECRYIADNCLEVKFPQNALRFVEIKLPEWSRPMRTVVRPPHPLALLQRFQLSEASTTIPVIIDTWPTLHIYGVVAEKEEPGVVGGEDDKAETVSLLSQLEAPDIGNSEVSIYKKPKISRIMAVVQPQEGVYEIDDLLLYS